MQNFNAGGRCRMNNGVGINVHSNSICGTLPRGIGTANSGIDSVLDNV
jgi:hypothetical protein